MSQYIKQTIEGVAHLTPVSNPTPIDTIPTEDSDHLITSGGVYNAIEGLNNNFWNIGVTRQYVVTPCPTPIYGFYYLPIWSCVPKSKTITIAQALAFDSTGGYTDVVSKLSIQSRENYDNYYIPVYTTDSSLVGKSINIVLSVS